MPWGPVCRVPTTAAATRLVPVLVMTALLTAGCGAARGPAARGASTAATHRHGAGRTAPAGSWRPARQPVPGADFSVVSCPVRGACLAGTTGGQTYRVSGLASTPVSSVTPGSPQGTSWLSCSSAGLCAAAPDTDQVTLLGGSAWQPPVTLPGAQGVTAVACAVPTFCIVIDGEGNSFAYDGRGWSGNLGAWGAAVQISCVSPTFCMAAEGGPSIWDGRTWSRPGLVDPEGQLNAVSCATTSFCVLTDSSGDAVTWDGTSFSSPRSVAAETAMSGAGSSGLTGVSCPTPAFCRAVDSVGRVFDWDGTRWSAGTLIDPGRSLSAIACTVTRFCMAVDRSGHVLVSS